MVVTSDGSQSETVGSRYVKAFDIDITKPTIEKLKMPVDIQKIIDRANQARLSQIFLEITTIRRWPNRNLQRQNPLNGETARTKLSINQETHELIELLKLLAQVVHCRCPIWIIMGTCPTPKLLLSLGNLKTL